MAHDHNSGPVSRIDQEAYRSNLRRLSPVWKLAVSLTLLVLCVSLRSIPVSLFVLASTAAVLCLAGKTPPRLYLEALGTPFVFILLGTIAVALEVGRAPAGDWSGRFLGLWWSCSRAGLLRAAQLAATALGAVSALYLQTMTTPVNEINSALAALHVAGLLIELTYLIYRFIFLLSATARQLRAAAQSRLGYCGFSRSLKTFGTSMGTLLVLSLRQAGDYYDAMLSRGYDGSLRFYEEKKPVTAVQAALGAVWALCPLAVWLVTR